MDKWCFIPTILTNHEKNKISNEKPDINKKAFGTKQRRRFYVFSLKKYSEI